ncbi:extracellular solute-binding protein [Rhodospirillum rubrum]|uniref:Extracellular solute-binding protein, family 5 n=1 Tax=Rhodospirillum rubrum (strain ATCC 11170 / ATH 1.1.1 / DSM 467 / LMG 4362 / NCIMB 8255 / S1) TaxID=269796 RepID=Q2RPI4_RHORT|nr:extracellular solute-binding protein [Rhodospirillum rubrum]ABC23961.1 extracellular solute-binding protein, family 5 [Rhodospirillum rubrum ATCC 11170]AEO49706.1 extracellular solute-binding protein [Rhodospirillum rubrum F11]MBK5955642.1 ABC transporter substrate-binding protein [Rhodospirillum rubrum]QXG79904.1 extracellular solute-binding protein [Rhodospirillum rubrum]HAP99816.1 ABC transporter substrate-binding protein [Rhodospirillum rubrum]
MRPIAAVTLAALLALPLPLATVQAAETASSGPMHALSLYGDIKYPADFTHFDYVNPEAPKGGAIRLSAFGTFDTLNPYTVKGTAAFGIGLTQTTLTVPSADEPSTEYGLVAQTMELAADRSWLIFTLRPEARWSDGQPITAEDVAFSFQILKDKGQPLYNSYYSNVTGVEVLDAKRVKFTFSPGENRELPSIVGQLPVLPKHYWATRDFAETTLDQPVSAGPYRIASFEPGRQITYERVKDYWAEALPVSKGMNNFDRIRYDYYRDVTVTLEGFKAGAFDFNSEHSAKNWATEYKFPAVSEGHVITEKVPVKGPDREQGFIFNMRRAQFQDPRVREALAYGFDFEWTNQTLFYGQYTRTRSFFENSELAAVGLPGPEELKILEPLRAQIPPRVFTEEYQPPVTDEAKGGLRANLKKALDLMKEAGWTVNAAGKMVNAAGQPFTFEILLRQADVERMVLPMVKNFERLGITATVRTVDTPQFISRVQSFDFDMVSAVWAQSNSPGNEQRDLWSSTAADIPGTSNLAGLKSPAVDSLIESVIAAPTRADLIARTRALDRVLQWSFPWIPHYYGAFERIAYWNVFGRPAVTPNRGVVFQAWWFDAEKAAKVVGRKGGF